MSADSISHSVYYKGQHIAEFKDSYSFAKWLHKNKKNYFNNIVEFTLQGSKHMVCNILDKQE